MLMMLATGASIISIIRGSFLQSEVFRYPPQPAKWCRGSDGLRRLVFKKAHAHDADFGGSWGHQKPFRNPSLPWGFAVGAHVNFGVVLEGVLEGPLEKRRSNDSGSAALTSAPWLSQGHGLPGRCPIFEETPMQPTQVPRKPASGG